MQCVVTSSTHCEIQCVNHVSLRCFFLSQNKCCMPALRSLQGIMDGSEPEKYEYNTIYNIHINKQYLYICIFIWQKSYKYTILYIGFWTCIIICLKISHIMFFTLSNFCKAALFQLAHRATSQAVCQWIKTFVSITWLIKQQYQKQSIKWSTLILIYLGEIKV